MQITVLFFGMLKDIVGKAEDGVTLEEGSSIGRLYELYAARFPKLAEHSSSILFSRNREFAGWGESLQDGDEVAFLPPVSGGSGDNGEPAEAASGDSNPCRLTREDALRVFFRQVNNSIKEDSAQTMIDAEMELTRKDSARQPERRRQQLVIDFERTSRGWKIVNITPRDFFRPL